MSFKRFAFLDLLCLSPQPLPYLSFVYSLSILKSRLLVAILSYYMYSTVYKLLNALGYSIVCTSYTVYYLIDWLLNFSDLPIHILQKSRVFCSFFYCKTMASTSFRLQQSDEVEDLITCPICLSEYEEAIENRKPKFLPCSHTVCLQCLKVIF